MSVRHPACSSASADSSQSLPSARLSASADSSQSLPLGALVGFGGSSQSRRLRARRFRRIRRRPCRRLRRIRRSSCRRRARRFRQVRRSPCRRRTRRFRQVRRRIRRCGRIRHRGVRGGYVITRNVGRQCVSYGGRGCCRGIRRSGIRRRRVGYRRIRRGCVSRHHRRGDYGRCGGLLRFHLPLNANLLQRHQRIIRFLLRAAGIPLVVAHQRKSRQNQHQPQRHQQIALTVLHALGSISGAESSQ